MKHNNYYDLKQINPNKTMKFKLYPRESGKSNYEYHKLKKEFNRQKRGKR